MPSLALAHRQARALMLTPLDLEDYVAAVDIELKVTPAGPARVHSALLAADALRAAGGNDESVAKRLDQAARAMTGDLRAPIERAVRGLREPDPANPPARLPDTPESAPLSAALSLLQRLRGVVPRASPVSSEALTANEALWYARQALDKGDAGTAAPFVAQLAALPELAHGVKWLASMLATTKPARRPDAARWLGELADGGDEQARRALVATAMELGSTELLSEAATGPGTLTAPERITLATLAGLPLSTNDERVEAAATAAGMEPLAAAVAALAAPDGMAQVRARAERTAGAPESRALVRIGRLLAASASTDDIDAAVAAFGESQSATVRAVALEMAARAARVDELSAAVQAWGASRPGGDDAAAGALAAGLLAERAGHAARANEAYKVARTLEPTSEAALRAIASIEQVDLVAELNALADELSEGPRSALVRIEAVARGEGVLPEPTRGDLLERAHASAPGLPIASFLAERIASRVRETSKTSFAGCASDEPRRPIPSKGRWTRSEKLSWLQLRILRSRARVSTRRTGRGPWM